MATILKRGTKWAVRWWGLDRRQHWRSCPDRRTSEALRREVESTLALGRDWEPQAPRLEADLEEVVFPRFVEVRSTTLGPRTLHRYGENLDLFVRFEVRGTATLPEGALRRLVEQTSFAVATEDHRFLRSSRPRGHLPAAMLSHALLEDFHVWLLQPENGLHGHARSADTARKIVEVVQLAWKWAEESDRWPGEVPRPRTIEMVRTPPQDVVAPSWEEMDGCVVASTGWQKKVATVLRYTGLRVGTVMLLEWRDLDLDAGTVCIRAEVDKEKKGRTVPLSKHLVAELAGWGVRDGYVIPSGRREGDRERLVRARDFSRAWARAGVRPEAWSVQPTHAFRKGWKTGMLALGAVPDAVDYLQGHVLGSGSRSRYIDPWQALHLRETVDLVPKIGAVTPVVRFATASGKAP